ncbi:hypothetical protein FHR22_000724 [Sphingopyxis panaciterrae]|uniref:hypothetical protein n=1 Tax=Sphingopyxis panaciterrae TaxID=363841 RepID=UPI00142276F9|nr:hypothetical protein [Sphingopyxis panaciterrae]NIJ36075.1 hypothetical protein [Sphingopyxis panaciterrae]
MKISFLAAGAALLTIFACSVPSTAADPLMLGGIAWQATPAAGRTTDGGKPHLRVSHSSSSSDLSFDRGRPELAGVQAALRGGAGPVSFTVVHEAGTLACTGTLKRAFDGGGRCRFTSDPRFEAELGTRGLAPGRRSDLLAMLLVDATVELADGLAREGVKAKDNGDLIAAAALEVTPAYVHDLTSSALILTDLGDAIACKALGVDGAYVRGLAVTGYTRLKADDVVSMKALGVSPDYAQAMNRAAKGKGR